MSPLQNMIDTPLSAEQLASPRISLSVIKPLSEEYHRLQHPAILFALFVCHIHFDNISSHAMSLHSCVYTQKKKQRNPYLEVTDMALAESTLHEQPSARPSRPTSSDDGLTNLSTTTRRLTTSFLSSPSSSPSPSTLSPAHPKAPFLSSRKKKLPRVRPRLEEALRQLSNWLLFARPRFLFVSSRRMQGGWLGAEHARVIRISALSKCGGCHLGMFDVCQRDKEALLIQF